MWQWVRRPGGWGRPVAVLVCLLVLVAGLPVAPVHAETPAGTAALPNWTSRASGSQADLLGVAYGNGTVVVVGKNGTALRTVGGQQWSAGVTGTAGHLNAVAFGAGRFVAVGNDGAILVSADGAQWRQRSSPSTAHLHDAMYGGGLFVAVGDGGALLTSADGGTWAARPTGTDVRLYAVAYGGGRFVAVGHAGVILTSTDGAAWTRAASGTDTLLSGVAYGGGQFLAVGEKGTVLVSPDAGSWTPVRFADQESPGLWQVTYGSGRFVGVGGVGKILSSPDGRAWAKNDADPVYAALNDVTFINGQFVAVGDDGIIRTSSSAPLGLEDPIGAPFLPPDSGSASGDTSSPPGLPGAENPPALPAVACKDGVVPGTRTTRQVSSLTIQADQATLREDGREEYCGNITLNRYLKLNGSLTVDSKNLEVEGNGTIYVEASSPRFHGALYLFSGDFTLNGDFSELIKQRGLDELEIAGMKVEISKLKLLAGGVQVGGSLELPKNIGGAKVDVENLEIVDGNLEIKGGIRLPKLSLGKSLMGLEDAAIAYDSKENAFGGRGTLIIPNLFGIGGELGFREARLDKVGFTLSGLNLAIDATGLFIQKIGGKVEGLTGPSALKITATTAITGGPNLFGFAAIKGEDLTITVDLAGEVSGRGKLVLVELLDVARGLFSISHANGFYLEATVNIIDVIEANLAVKVNRERFYGSANAAVVVPRFIPLKGGDRLTGISMVVDNGGLSGEIQVTAFRVWATFPWRGGPQWGWKVRLWGMYRVPYLASTSLVALGLPKQGFTMPDGIEQAVVTIRWDASDADFSLVAPDGRVITPTEAPLSSTTVRYAKNGARREAIYWLYRPKAGEWVVQVVGTGVTTYTVELAEVEVAPKLTISVPYHDLVATGSVPIHWTTDAPAGSRVSLFYAPAPDQPGTILADGLDADLGRYTWDTAGVPSGVYYIYGTVDDGKRALGRGVAPGTVRVTNPGTPAVPGGLSVHAVNGNLDVTWTPGPEPDIGGYKLHLLGSPGQTVATGRENHYLWSGLQPGRTYQVTVSAFNAEGLESERSAPVSVFLPAPDPPTLRVDWPLQAVTNQATLPVSGWIGSGGTGLLYRDDQVVGQGLSGSFNVAVTLRPGRNTLRLTAAKANGDTAVSEKEYFYDPIPPQLTVQGLKSAMEVDGPAINISGTVEPTSQLSLNGGAVPVRPDGTYTTILPLTPGPNRVDLVARDEAGNENAFHGVITARGTTGRGCGTVFPDVGADHPACAAIEHLAGLRVLSGYTDGTFKPDRGVTRAEFTKMLVVTLGITPNPGARLIFSDSKGHWAATQGYLQAAAALKAIGGFPDGSFRPDHPVTRAQAVKIVAAVAGLNPEGLPIYTDVQAQDWFATWVAAAERSHLIGGSAPSMVWAETVFRGNQPATRAEAAIILANLLSLKRSSSRPWRGSGGS